MENFFEESSEQSIVKATIVAKYFWAWAKVVIPTARTHSGKIAYMDLFAGPGRYQDGTKSTPLLVLERAIQDPDMRQMLVTFFNDADPENARSLKTAIRNLPGVETLKYEPQVKASEVGEKIVKTFESVKLVPTLFFVDPWGYKGLSLRLVNSVLKDWGCDCVFFFNYNRINMGLGNPYVEEHMNALFGRPRADALRARLNVMKPSERELAILEEIVQALLFELFRPLDDLEGMLSDSFAGRKLKMREVYKEHSVGKRYVSKNYKDALISLEAKGAITANLAAADRKKNKGHVTFADDVVVTFSTRR